MVWFLLGKMNDICNLERGIFPTQSDVFQYNDYEDET